MDDVEENLILLSRILTREGYAVETLSCSGEVLCFAKKLQPALILLDILMPEMDGIEVCRKLKSDPLTCSIPVIFISALGSTTEKLRGFQAGAVDFIVKPLEIEETLARVKTHIVIHRLQEQLQETNLALDARVFELVKSQERLRKNENEWNAFINALPNLVIIYDEEGTYIEILGKKLEHTVINFEDMVGKKLEDLLPAEVAKMKMDAIRSVIQTGQTKVIEYQLPVKNGELLWFEGRIALIERYQQNKGKVICVISEITERMELYQKVQNLAIHDPLTNCYNRYHFSLMTKNEIARSIRYNHPLTLLLIDVDHFKQINDQYGHIVGDQALCQISSIFQHSIRETDILCRYGGEEFFILFPETDLQRAMDVAERIRRQVEEQVLHTNQGDITITVSGGLTSLENLQSGGTNIDDFFIEADKALYAAKNDGRNCIRVFHHQQQ